MKDFKIDLSMYDGKVRELMSEAVQIKAFELGYAWEYGGKKVQYEHCPALCFEAGGRIFKAEYTDKFNTWSNTEISITDFLALKPEDVKEEPKEPELKPFDRVLVRDFDDQMWIAHLYSHRDENVTYIHRTIGDAGYNQCIPYEGNEHLLGTTEEPK